MERPNRNDTAILKAAATEIAIRCAEWAGDGSEPDEWVDDLCEALRYGRDDGYELAKYLDDRAGVTPDAELVDILSDAWHVVSRVYNAALAAWSEATGFAPAFNVGDRVHTPRGPGIIRSIDEKRASYCVKLDSETRAHVLGTYVNAEDVTAERVPV